MVMAVVAGERYLVSMLGANAGWVKNMEAAGGNVTLHHGRHEQAHLEEVATEQRAPLLKAYLQRAPGARAHIPADVGDWFGWAMVTGLGIMLIAVGRRARSFSRSAPTG